MEITVNGVSYAYGRRHVLHEVDWVLRPGVTGLLGENGAGKTTLLTVLIGLLRPAKGVVTVHNRPSARSLRVLGDDGDASGNVSADVGADLDGNVRFGFVPQRFSLPGHMRVVDVVAYTAWVNGVPPRECESAAYDAVRSVALGDKAKDRVRSLSGGQRQRLGIAAGLAHDPDVLVLDEPTVGLDPGQRSRVRDLIAEIGQTRTVVLSTHLLDDVSYLCQRVGVLAGGRLVFDGTVNDLERQGGTEERRTDGRRSPIERGYERLLDNVGGIE
ncbi:ABC transporter ATP-binding protein [Actinophytocola sediminis]